jgi:hypothetical protein
MSINLLFFLLVPSNAQDFSGTYASKTATGQIILSLGKTEAGIYSGALSGNNNVFKLTGQVQNNILKGRIGEEGSTLLFTAGLKNGVLTFTMAENDVSGNLNPSTSKVLTFVKSAGSSPDIVQNSGNVSNNNKILSKAQILEITIQYGVEPKAGNYWYDPVSGLYGVAGFPSYGFMYPGHNFGPLSRNASSANTGVIIIGRELPQMEWAVLSYILGNYVQTGSYWLDAKGNVGYEGNFIPVVNLFAAAQKNAYSGKGSIGDNFWSSRFSAGNSNADNSQGYVSVPGYSPVGYGFKPRCGPK